MFFLDCRGWPSGDGPATRSHPDSGTFNHVPYLWRLYRDPDPQIRTVPMDYGSGSGSVPYPALFLSGLRYANKNSCFAYDGMYLL